jgi:uncharacterized protein YjiS (DUF1127 family)
MIEISMTPPAGSLAKFVAWLGHAWQDRQARASIAAMSEREYQDIGWGQSDRWATHLNDVEPPEDRRARAIALNAWRAPNRKAA